MKFISFATVKATASHLIAHVETQYQSHTINQLFEAAICKLFRAEDFNVLMANPADYSTISQKELSKEDMGELYLSIAKKLSQEHDFHYHTIYQFIERYLSAIQDIEAFAQRKSVVGSTALALDLLQETNQWAVTSTQTTTDGVTLEYINLQSKAIDMIEEGSGQYEVTKSITLSTDEYSKRFGNMTAMLQNSSISTQQLSQLQS